MKQTCKTCKSSYYFDDSRIPDDGLNYRCPKCGGTVFFKKLRADDIAEAEMLDRKEFPRAPFFELLARAFYFPFKGNGKILLMAGTVSIGIVNFFLRYNIIPFIGVIVAVLVAGYLSAYLIKVINHSADGEEELPDFPDFTDWWDSILHPFFLILLTIIFSFLPAIAYRLLITSKFSDPVFLLLIGWGLFYIPMGMIAVAMSESLKPLNPLFIIPSIIKVIDRYVIACALLAVILAVEVLMKKVLALSFPLLGDLLRTFLLLYFLTIEARILGLIYYENRERLSWFGEG